MSRQVQATHFSVLLHLLFLGAALGLNQRAISSFPSPVALDFSILPLAGPVEGGQQAAPAAKSDPPPAPPVEKKPPPKPEAKKKIKAAAKAKPLSPKVEKTAHAETVPMDVHEHAQPSPDGPASRDNSAPASHQQASASPVTGSDSGQLEKGGGGVPYGIGQLDGTLTVLSAMPPVYPPAAKQRNIEGWVRVEFVVTEEGKVGRISVVDAEPKGIFEQAVLRCVNKWRFKPGTVKGTAVSTRVEQTIAFQLE